VPVFAVCRELVGGEAPASQQCSTPGIGHDPGCTSMHFGENQLSPCSIGISPLPTAHPNLLQQIAVRAFTGCYARCTLAMGSSHGFRSAGCHGCALHTRVRSASGYDCLKPATPSNSSGHTPKGTRSRLSTNGPRALTAWTRSVSGSVSLPSPGCFSPFPHGTVRYRSRRVVGLGPWSARLPTRLLVSRGTRDGCLGATWTGTGLSPAVVRHPSRFPVHVATECRSSRIGGRSHNPACATAAPLARTRFRHQPISLATTLGGIVLPPATEMFQFAGCPPTGSPVGAHPDDGRVAPFGDGGLNAWLRLPHPNAAVQRPSSARRAEASSNRASCLAWSPGSSTIILDCSISSSSVIIILFDLSAHVICR
jgi:hypothetical protein